MRGDHFGKLGVSLLGPFYSVLGSHKIGSFHPVRDTWWKEQFQWHDRIKAKLILTLRADELSVRAISTSLRSSKRNVTSVLDAVEQKNISCEQVQEKSEMRCTGYYFRDAVTMNASTPGMVGLPFTASLPRWA